MQRHEMSDKQSRSMFTNTARKTHKLNTKSRPMRGGFRI